MRHITCLRSDDVCFVRIGEIQKLIELVGTYIRDDSAKILFVEEPLRTCIGAHSVRGKNYSLNHITNCSFFY